MNNYEFNSLISEVNANLKVGSHLLTSESENILDDTLQELSIYWKIVRPILKAAKLLSNSDLSKIIGEFIAIVDKLCQNTLGDEQSELLEQFSQLWGYIKPVLESAKNFINNPEAEEILDGIIKVGDILTKSLV